MDILHLVTSAAPDLTTARDNKPTLLLSWWCTCYAIAVIVIRFCGRYVRAEKVFLEDGIMCLAITPLLIRMVFVHFVLKDGTNNTVTDGLSVSDISRRELGSQLVLAARVFYAAYLWAIKYSTTLFLRTLSESVSQGSHRRLLRYLHIFLFATFIATIVADLGACQPFSHYWQVVPDPGAACRTGSAHLYTMGGLNIITNLALVGFPLPMILKSRVEGRRKFSILLQLSLPLLSVALTSYSLSHIPHHHFSQQTRSLLASLDILLSTFISNSIVLFSLLSDRGYKKSKYKYDGQDASSHAQNRGANWNGNKGSGGERGRWDSDDELIIVEDGGGAKEEVGIGLRDLGGSGGGNGNGKGGVGSRRSRGSLKGEVGIEGGRGVKRPASVKLARAPAAEGEVGTGRITVNQTWEISVEDK